MCQWLLRALIPLVLSMLNLNGSAVAWAHSGSEAPNMPASKNVMSVSRLLTHANGQPVTPIPPHVSGSMRKSLAKEQVFMFVAGVIDSGEGWRWCLDAVEDSRLDIVKRLIDALREDAVPERAAAVALGERLEARFPCATRVTAERQSGSRP